MYSKAEKSAVKKEFWTSFGSYMKPVPNASGNRINWLNYKTGVKNIYIRMDADTQSCSIGIEIKHPEVLQRKAFFVKFISFKSHFKATVDGGWSWLEEIQDDDGSTVSKIVAEKKGVNVLNKESWPEMISFFKERLVALDDFWLTVKPLFE